MIAFLSRFFIKDRNNTASPEVRRAYGMLCGTLGIVLNVFLFGVKFFAGLLSSSIAITSDAFNNLSDAGSSVITLVGFKMSGRKPDPQHPFGHGRIEYISSLIVSFIIIIIGVELGKSSIEKIIHPEPIEFSVLVCVILAVSVCVKAYMVIYNKLIGKKIDSTAMRVVSADSLNDCIATSVVLIATLVSHFFNVNIDGPCGVAVAGFILISGIKAAKETISPLLGEPADPGFVQSVSDLVLAHDEIKGIHDLVVHNYGPGRIMISLHAEVPADGSIAEIHDTIDNIEHELEKNLDCHAVIHMDPISWNDDEVISIRAKVEEKVKEIDGKITVHDFRIVKGPTHTNLIFDIVIPYDVPLNDDEIKSQVLDLVQTIDKTYFSVINIDRPFFN